MPVMQKGWVVHAWPQHMQLAVDALGSEQAMALISVPTPDTTDRGLARERIRAALQETLAVYLDHPAASITLVSHPGQAIWLDGPVGGLQVSVSHMPTLSVAAISRCGAIGVDVMQVDQSAELMPDWARVALDYLGPTVTGLLQHTAPAQRAGAFAQAWTHFEASLKCLGMALTEWTPTLAQPLASCRVMALELPENCRGAVAIKRSAAGPGRETALATAPRLVRASATCRGYSPHIHMVFMP